ncbi:ABC transporter permease [Synergistaceae bacterium OttesenSCG-928-D05]|nr:ABC transporter permease [Synergistaceae bacterium OttesenSCG-928-D05]
MIRLKFEPRLDNPAWMNVMIPVAAVLTGLFAGGVLFAFLGVNPFRAYWAVLVGAFGSTYGLSEIVTKAIPITLTALAGLICYRMLIWNIGAEGQLCLGAIATVAVVRYFYVDSRIAMFALMFLAAALAGGVWGGVSGFLKAKWNVNETITTLMLNYVAINLSEYFIYGPWKDPMSMGFPFTPNFPPAARFWVFGSTRIHGGIFIALAITLIFQLLLKRSKWGYEIRVIGENPRAARYAGINIAKNILLVTFIGGAVAGLAGMSEMAGLHGRMSRGFSMDYGYTGIIVAWLARLSPIYVPLVAFLMGVLLVGGDTLQVVMGLPHASIKILQGLILFSMIGAETLSRFRIRIVRVGLRAKGEEN